MIRVLVMIAIGGFVLSVGCLSAAFAIGGEEAIARGWRFAHHERHGDWSWDDHPGRGSSRSGNSVTRTLQWGGGDTLISEAPADIVYVQAAGPAKLTVSGPQALVDAVTLTGGRLSLTSPEGFADRKLRVELSAPGVSRFELAGANRLRVEDYKQPRLSLKMSGASDVDVQGETETLDLAISGAGAADLRDLKVRDAQVDISGAGKARIAPIGRAKLSISGFGQITLDTTPAQLETSITGAGRVRERGKTGRTRDESETET